MADEIKRPLRVFLCHARGDKSAVRDLYERLIAEGVDAWLDQEKLLPGQDWRVEIPRAVREADVVVICLSNNSITKEGYVQKEIKFALDSAEEKPEDTIFLIPARLEDCVVPERLGRWQWVDLFEENGIVRLLRSLKLRADRVGATVEPIGYESEDQETERKIEQLYTEGLAAFYTEDWDRAYQRFQAILRERPNHKNAAEKLAEAERQRSLSKLYSQATEAVRSEDWQVAIKILEELAQKSAAYKDVAQLLGTARKQKRLRELYAEAKTLHTAQKWQAVVKVFEQISVIEPQYPDPDGLLASAQREAAELKRLADLNDLYSQGIHKMDAGEWYEARSLLEQVHKAQTGFLDTEGLLRKVENEILRIEEGRKRNAQVQMLYEQARKMTRSGQWGKALAQMEEIQRLDHQFVDSDGILEKSKAEVEREEQESQRRRELAALYAEAVSFLEAKKYQEALEKWNAIQAIDPKYKDTSRVKTIARRKLDELSRPEAVGRPWSKIINDWIGAQANIPVEREIFTERLLLLSFVAIAIIVQVYLIVMDLFHIREASIVVRFLSLFSLGGLYGVVVAFVLSNAMSNWHRKQSLTVIIGWALAQSVPWIVQQYFAVDFITIYALFAGLSTTAAIRSAKPATRPITLIIIFSGWILAWKVGAPLGTYLQTVFNSQYIAAIADPLSVLLGLLFTFGIQVEGSWEVFRTAFFGTLGFAVGNYVAYITDTLVSLPAEMAFALWGLIGGAILEAPSRDSRRILSSAAIGGIGLLVGSFVTRDILPLITVEYANSTLSDKYATLHQPFWGIGLGLAFGVLIGRASAIAVLAILGGGMYMITRALNADAFNLSASWENIVRGALIGLVFGYGYGYMRKAKALESKSRVAKAKWVWMAIIGFLAIAIPVVIWLSSPPPFTSYRWDFDNSAEGWGDYHDISLPQSFDGYLTFRSTGGDPSFESPASLVIDTSITPVITIRMRVKPGQDTDGQIFFVTSRDNNWDGTKSVVFTTIQDGTFQTYNILMSENSAWQGVITKLRLDPCGYGNSVAAINCGAGNAKIEIDYISVHAP